MTFMRLFLLTATVFVFVGCFKKEKEPETRVVTPKPAMEQDRAADALFDEFFDNSSKKTGDVIAPPPNQRNTSSFSAPIPVEFTFSPNGRYVVQVSTVASVDLANSIVKKFERMGYPAYSAQVENPTTSLIGIYYRVRIGGFSGIAEAKNFGEAVLRPLGYDYWVDNKSNDNIGIGGMGLGSYQQAVDYNTLNPSTTPQQSTFEIEQTTPTPPPATNSWDNFEW
ncbi:MAG: SPOR domain-containing protein [Chitinivibrionia bacterium]|nr:SPOR domain-containing protein [Chitinivibrionia bacterium]